MKYNNSKVAVLLSVYNGRKFLKEQLDSILNQTYKNIEIYVRDDGSTDTSLDLLKEYEKDEKIRLISGENKGFINSFFTLLKKADGADYYAWCDQDDIWIPQKIEWAVKRLEQEEKSIPLLYFTNYDYYDENMNFQKHSDLCKRGPSFCNSLMDCITLGFNSVFNAQARIIMVKNIPKYSCGHDWWTYMVCAAFGKVIYDSRYTVYYRRLQQSVSPGGKDFWKMQVWRFKKFFLNGYFKKIKKQLWEFSQIYQDDLDPENRKLMSYFSKMTYSPARAIKKMIYPKPFRQNFIEECMVRLLFLLGRL